MNKPVNKTSAWKKLTSYYRWHKNDEMKDLFAKDKDRASKYTLNQKNIDDWIEITIVPQKKHRRIETLFVRFQRCNQ